MKMEDFMDMDSARNKAIGQLAEICAAMGLNWIATETTFTIDLPQVVVMKASSIAVVPMPTNSRKTFDISTWGEPGPVEGPTTYKTDESPFNATANPDGSVDLEYKDGFPKDMQLPDYGEILEEGEAPKGDPDAEN